MSNFTATYSHTDFITKKIVPFNSEFSKFFSKNEYGKLIMSPCCPQPLFCKVQGRVPNTGWFLPMMISVDWLGLAYVVLLWPDGPEHTEKSQCRGTLTTNVDRPVCSLLIRAAYLDVSARSSCKENRISDLANKTSFKIGQLWTLH